MATRSIFEKVCPSCMATLAIDAKQCACGYDFSQSQSEAGLSSEEIRLKAEELYENYLAARANQAAQAVKTAQALFANDPANPDKSSRVGDAIREAREAQTALQAQSARIAEMKKALRPAVATAVPPSAPIPAAIPTPMAAAPKKRPAVKPALKPIPVRATRKAITAVATVTVTAAKRAANAPVQSTAPKNHAPAAPVKPAAPAQSAVPNKAFRKAQAAKAEKILRAAQAAKPAAEVNTEKLPEAPVVEINPPPSPVAATPVKTAPRLYAAPDKKDCPNCTASVALNASRCRCGYEFSSSEQHIPALTMSEEERAAFAKLFT